MGNINHQVNTSNVVVAEYNFDACSVKLGFCECSETKTEVELIPKSEAGREGRRRSADDWSYTLDANDLALFADRGFTGHEYLKYFNLYNMNGRLYDPLVSRFLSPDPYIQDHTSTLDYNRYAYCLNNPLKYTDPSGNKYFQFVDPEFGPEGQLRWYAPNLDSIFRNARKSGGSMYNGGSYGAPGQGLNGRGLNGVYYDWYNDSYRSTNMGNSEVGWNNAYNNSILPNSTVYRYGTIGGWSNEAKDGYYINIKPIYGWYDASGWDNTVASGGGGRHSIANDLWNITMGGAGTLADVTSNGLHNSIYWVQKNGKVTFTKNIGNNYLLKRSNRIVRETLQNGKMVAKSLTQLNIAYSATDYALTWATTGMPTFGQGMDLFFTSVAAIPGAGWAVSGGYWVISAGSYAITGEWMSEHMDSWVY